MIRIRQYTKTAVIKQVAKELQKILDEDVVSGRLKHRLNLIKHMALLALEEGDDGQES